MFEIKVKQLGSLDRICVVCDAPPPGGQYVSQSRAREIRLAVPVCGTIGLEPHLDRHTL